VSHPVNVREIANFQAKTIERLAANRPDVLVLYSVAWDPLGLLNRKYFVDFLRRYYDYESQVTSAGVKDKLGMHSVAKWTESGQWIEVFEADDFRPRRLTVRNQPIRDEEFPPAPIVPGKNADY
jgi:hypothetical protein